MGQCPGHRRKTRSAPGPYAGPSTCLRCDRTFQSWDRRQNRLCPPCREALEQEPSEEPTCALPPPVRRARPLEDGRRPHLHALGLLSRDASCSFTSCLSSTSYTAVSANQYGHDLFSAKILSSLLWTVSFPAATIAEGHHIPQVDHG